MYQDYSFKKVHSTCSLQILKAYGFQNVIFLVSLISRGSSKTLKIASFVLEFI